MVGKTKGLAELTGKYIGKSFEEINCLEMAHNFYKEIGGDFPDKFKNYNLYNYIEYWELDRENAVETLNELWESLPGEDVSVDDIKQFDFLMMQDIQTENIYIAILIQNNMVMVSSLKEGVRMSFIGERHKVLKARRIL